MYVCSLYLARQVNLFIQYAGHICFGGLGIVVNIPFQYNY